MFELVFAIIGSPIAALGFGVLLKIFD